MSSEISQERDLAETPENTNSQKITASSSSRKRRKKLLHAINSDSDSDMENIADGGLPTSSTQRKRGELKEKRIAAARKISNGGSDDEEAAHDQQFAMQRCYNKEEHRDISPSSSSDSEFGRPSPHVWGSKDLEGNCKVSETPENSPKMVASNSSRKRRKKLPSHLDSDSDKENTAYDCLTPPSKLGKRRVPLSEEKVNKQHLLQKLKEKRIAAAEKTSSKGSENSSEVADQQVEQVCSMKKYYDEAEHHDMSPCAVASSDSEEGGQDESQNVSVIDVESSDETSSSDSSFIDDAEINSQDIQELDHELMLLKRPSLKQAHNYYLRITLKKLLHNNSANETESDLWFEKCKHLLEDTLTSKKQLVGSSAWCDDFKKMIQTHFVLRKEKLCLFKDDDCQACIHRRHITQCLVFYDEDKNVVQKFLVGIYCAERGALFHDLHNYLLVELERKCKEKINEVTENASDEEIMSDDDWTEKLFKRFQDLMNEADKWAEDGDKRRKMKLAVSVR